MKNRDIDILAPAAVGYEGKRAAWWPSGRCTFLTADGMCELHSLGLKPVEGRLANHAHLDQNNVFDDLHESVAATWENKEARRLVEQWKNAHSG